MATKRKSIFSFYQQFYHHLDLNCGEPCCKEQKLSQYFVNDIL